MKNILKVGFVGSMGMAAYGLVMAGQGYFAPENAGLNPGTMFLGTALALTGLILADKARTAIKEMGPSL